MEWNIKDWKVEEYRLMNMKKEEVYGQRSPVFRNGNKIFRIENGLTNQEKLDIIDDMYNGLGSLIYNFITAWEKEKHKVKRTSTNSMHKASQVSLLKKIFPQTKLISKGLTKYASIDLDYKVGEYWMFGEKYKQIQTITPTTDYGYQLAYDGKNIVNQWFHSMLKKLEAEERKHYKENNPKILKIKKVQEYANIHGQFNGRKINDIIWNSDEDVSEEYLDKIIVAYEKLEVYKNKLDEELQKQYELEI